MRLAGWVVLGLLGTVGAVVGTYETVPTHNTEATHFDTLIVLGSPADPDGKASPEERERVMEAVREFRAGRAGHIIVSGGAVHNEWTEADIMAGIAVGAGVPAADVLVEGRARNTVQNIFYSHGIMEAHGWTTAEVVSSPSHLPRAGLILEHWKFGWRTHASRWPASMSASGLRRTTYMRRWELRCCDGLGIALRRFCPQRTSRVDRNRFERVGGKVAQLMVPGEVTQCVADWLNEFPGVHDAVSCKGLASLNGKLSCGVDAATCGGDAVEPS